MPVKKKKTLAKAKNDLKPIFSLYIRMRDCLLTTGSLEYGECITCDFSGHISQLDAGHFRPKHSGNYFSERGVHAQCRKCNRYSGGKPLEYRRQIIKLYGEGVDLELEEEARQIRKFTIPELEEMKRDYKERIRIMEEENDGRTS